jgi:hypothetical protein
MSKDHSGLVSVARALWGLQSVYGDIPNTLAQGRSVRKLLNMVAMFNHQFGQPPTKQVSSCYNSVGAGWPKVRLHNQKEQIKNLSGRTDLRPNFSC